MLVQFYDNKSGINVINKNLDIVGNPIEFTLKKDVNIIHPILILKQYSGGNYCYIPDFNRYYFVDNYNLLSNGCYEIYLSVDVLTSYKNDLEEGKILINSEYNSVYYLDNDEEYKDIYTNNQYLLLTSKLI